MPKRIIDTIAKTSNDLYGLQHKLVFMKSQTSSALAIVKVIYCIFAACTHKTDKVVSCVRHAQAGRKFKIKLQHSLHVEHETKQAI